jgi:hypothetical protein
MEVLKIPLILSEYSQYGYAAFPNGYGNPHHSQKATDSDTRFGNCITAHTLTVVGVSISNV